MVVQERARCAIQSPVDVVYSVILLNLRARDERHGQRYRVHSARYANLKTRLAYLS